MSLPEKKGKKEESDVPLLIEGEVPIKTLKGRKYINEQYGGSPKKVKVEGSRPVPFSDLGTSSSSSSSSSSAAPNPEVKKVSEPKSSKKPKKMLLVPEEELLALKRPEIEVDLQGVSKSNIHTQYVIASNVNPLIRETNKSVGNILDRADIPAPPPFAKSMGRYDEKTFSAPRTPLKKLTPAFGGKIKEASEFMRKSIEERNKLPETPQSPPHPGPPVFGDPDDGPLPERPVASSIREEIKFPSYQMSSSSSLFVPEHKPSVVPPLAPYTPPKTYTPPSFSMSSEKLEADAARIRELTSGLPKVPETPGAPKIQEAWPELEIFDYPYGEEAGDPLPEDPSHETGGSSSSRDNPEKKKKSRKSSKKSKSFSGNTKMKRGLRGALSPVPEGMGVEKLGVVSLNDKGKVGIVYEIKTDEGVLLVYNYSGKSNPIYYAVNGDIVDKDDFAERFNMFLDINKYPIVYVQAAKKDDFKFQEEGERLYVIQAVKKLVGIKDVTVDMIKEMETNIKYQLDQAIKRGDHKAATRAAKELEKFEKRRGLMVSSVKKGENKVMDPYKDRKFEGSEYVYQLPVVEGDIVDALKANNIDSSQARDLIGTFMNKAYASIIDAMIKSKFVKQGTDEYDKFVEKYGDAGISSYRVIRGSIPGRKPTKSRMVLPQSYKKNVYSMQPATEDEVISYEKKSYYDKDDVVSGNQVFENTVRAYAVKEEADQSQEAYIKAGDLEGQGAAIFEAVQKKAE